MLLAFIIIRFGCYLTLRLLDFAVIIILFMNTTCYYITFLSWNDFGLQASNSLLVTDLGLGWNSQCRLA